MVTGYHDVDNQRRKGFEGFSPHEKGPRIELKDLSHLGLLTVWFSFGSMRLSSSCGNSQNKGK